MASLSNSAAAETPAQPWHAAYPAPKCTAPVLSRLEVLKWLREGRKDFVLVDLRRADFEGGTICGSLNLPAQTLYPSLPTLYSVLSGANVKRVIWYCGSCGGRGTRAAAWFADYIESQQDTALKSFALEGGIKGWVASGSEYTEWMDGYDASSWAST
ncbi:arsenate reductase (Arc2) [Penicillium longicatenatum]|uniref:arsenate reductase (Arc2) n=1 Tax=Penicillium longicatenatum TaxID=1561947 RepID=UPI00254954C2|nr:arsenate reductase (Arc2) [Penicillium longicatenatum]KAJ5650116.1 arsenate reductase (Arc2) [Penicillium longicatenatum]KAJ5672337.1 arsenate reductase (Arc2) [Penicillium longicatenatum]